MYKSYIYGFGREFIYHAPNKTSRVSYWDPRDYSNNTLVKINEGFLNYRDKLEDVDVPRSVFYGRQYHQKVSGEDKLVYTGFMVVNKEKRMEVTDESLIYGKGIA